MLVISGIFPPYKNKSNTENMATVGGGVLTLFRFGIAEALNEGVLGAVSSVLAETGRKINPVEDRSGLVIIGENDKDASINLLVFSPLMAENWDGGFLISRLALLPGASAAKMAGHLKAGCAVSYGLSAKDSITASSLKNGRITMAIQRELVTLEGKIVERQEIPLKQWSYDPLIQLAAAGTLLLLGVPEKLLSSV